MMRRLSRPVLIAFFALISLFAMAPDAMATHFRYGTITWTTPNPAQPRVIQVRFDSAWRRSYFAGVINIGTVLSLDGTIPGDLEVLNAAGTSLVMAPIPINATVTGINNTEDWVTASWTTTITLPPSGSDFLLRFRGCCRISTLLNANNDRDYIVLSRVTLRAPVNRPPTSASLPIITVPVNQSVNFTVPAFDPDGDPLTFSLSPSNESGLVTVAPPGLPSPTPLNVSPTGVVSWRPAQIGLHAVQFKVTDGPLPQKGASTAIDVLFSVVASTTAAPPPTLTVNGAAPPATFNVTRGSHLTFNVAAASTNGSPAFPVTLSSSTLPLGANMSPSLPTSAFGNVSSSFNWTPAPSQVGSYIISYSAVNGTGQQTIGNVNINVTNEPPTVLCSANGGTIEATGPAGALFTVVSDLHDADAADRLLYQVFIDGVLRATIPNLDPPANQDFQAMIPVGSHTYEVRVTDSVSPSVSCSGTFSIVDTTAPTLFLPDDISLVATGPGGAVATFPVSATDVVDPTPSLACHLPSGSMFPVGTSTVLCAATDFAQNQATGTFQVHVARAPAFIDPMIVSPNGIVGAPLVVNTQLMQTPAHDVPLAGGTVRFVLTGPGAAEVREVVTDLNGNAHATFTPSVRGLHTLEASYLGSTWQMPVGAPPVSISVYQRTQLFISVANGTAGETIVERAELRALPLGTQVAGKTVHFSYSGPGPVAPAVATTDGSGASAIVHSTFPLPGTYLLTTTFSDPDDFFTDAAGTIPPAPTVTSAPITISPVFTSMSAVSAFNNDQTVGTTIVAMSGLSRTSTPAGGLEGRVVVFTMVSPGGSTSATATTTASGSAQVEFTFTERGAHTITASYAGDAATSGSTAAPNTFDVYQLTTIALAPAEGIAGGVTPLTATLMLWPQNTPVANQSIQFSSSGMQPATVTGVTDAFGVATTTGTFPSQGTNAITASFVNTADFFIASTAATTASIAPAAASIAVVAPASALVGQPLTVNAMLSRADTPIGPVASAVLLFRVTPPSNQVFDLVAATDAAGNAEVMFTPTERGVHAITVIFDGDQSLAPSSSPAVNVSVYQRTQLTLAPVQGGNTLPVVATLLALPQNSPLGNQQVQFSFDGAAPPQAAHTNPAGAATVLVTFPSVGTFSAHASFSNAADFLTDAAGSMPPLPSTAAAPVTIVDSTPPAITVSVSGTPGNNGWHTSDVVVTWSVVDPQSQPTSTGCAPATIAADGTVTLTCSATSAGGMASESVTVRRDATTPVLSLPGGFTVPATSGAGASVPFMADAQDATSGLASFSCLPASGSVFAIGNTTVTCTAIDNAGLSSSGSFVIGVSDTIAPVITGASPSEDALWPPNHQLVPVTITVTAIDNLGPAPVCSVAGVTSNEPQNGLGDGDTPNDWVLTGGLTLQLRAERGGRGDGRIYTVTVRCVDGSGNAATSTTTVSVPKSQRK